MAEENFLKNSTFLNALKLRASYGEVGNEDIGSTSQFLFPYLGANEVGWNIVGETGVIPVRAANPDLTWENIRKLILV